MGGEGGPAQALCGQCCHCLGLPCRGGGASLLHPHHRPQCAIENLRSAGRAQMLDDLGARRRGGVGFPDAGEQRRARLARRLPRRPHCPTIPRSPFGLSCLNILWAVDKPFICISAGLQPALAGIAGDGPGVLEIKCPFNRGNPAQARPYCAAPHYYMPQVQGLMEIFDREWCNAYAWTLNGSTVYHIRRDRGYWATMYEVLADFWWQHVVPAKHALAEGRPADMQAFRYVGVHFHLIVVKRDAGDGTHYAGRRRSTQRQRSWCGRARAWHDWPACTTSLRHSYRKPESLSCRIPWRRACDRNLDERCECERDDS